MACDHSSVDQSLMAHLSGDRLESVVFVADYLQLNFRGGLFSAYVWPTVAMDGQIRHFGEPGYRDALCGLIGHEVLTAGASPEAGLVISFALGTIVTNPESYELAGPEIAMLQLHEGPFQEAAWDVWRPAEDVFSGELALAVRPHIVTALTAARSREGLGA
jgi:hypothetical protein